MIKHDWDQHISHTWWLLINANIKKKGIIKQE